MAGKIIADQIQSTTAGTLDTKYVVNGSAKSWNFFQGTGTVTINDSFNVSSMTDIGTGTYDQNFSNNMSSANYSIQILSGRSAAITGDNQCAVYDNSKVPVTSDFRIRTASESFGGQDITRIYTTNHGDLA